MGRVSVEWTWLMGQMGGAACIADSTDAASLHGRPRPPTWAVSIATFLQHAQIAKCAQNGFRDTTLDRYLRAWNIDLLLMVGFSFTSYLFYTVVGAFEHTYRGVVVRDRTAPEGTSAFADSSDPALPEQG